MHSGEDCDCVSISKLVSSEHFPKRKRYSRLQFQNMELLWLTFPVHTNSVMCQMLVISWWALFAISLPCSLLDPVSAEGLLGACSTDIFTDCF